MNKHDLFEEQKIFIMYLLSSIPSFEDWSLNVDYKRQKDEILNTKSVQLDKTEIDLAKFHGKSISEVRREKLISEKKIKLKELNEKFGVEESKNDFEIIDSFEPDDSNKDSFKDNPTGKELWDILDMKGLLKPEADKK